MKLYRRAWICALVIALVLRFTFFLHAPSGQRFHLGLAFMLGTWLPLMFLNGFESRRLMLYLKEHHPLFWESLTARSLSFFPATVKLCSKDDLGDPVVAALKDERRRFMRLGAAMFFTYPVVLIIIAT
ncbi:MAG: hypothetical protein WDM80_15755 [Limisphaerales bacterium]